KRVNIKGPGKSEEEVPMPNVPAVRSPLAQESSSTTVVGDTSSSEGGPFMDPPERSSGRSSHTSTPSLSAVIEEATRRAARVERPKSVTRETSPFGDEHATRD